MSYVQKVFDRNLLLQVSTMRQPLFQFYQSCSQMLANKWFCLFYSLFHSLSHSPLSLFSLLILSLFLCLSFSVSLSLFIYPNLYISPPGVNFINVLRTAFTLVGPKSVKRYWQLDWVITLWGTTGVKAVRRTLMKSSPVLTHSLIVFSFLYFTSFLCLKNKHFYVFSLHHSFYHTFIRSTFFFLTYYLTTTSHFRWGFAA